MNNKNKFKWNCPLVKTLAAALSFLGLSVLYGWFTNNTALTTLNGYSVPMMPITAMCFTLSGISIILPATLKKRYAALINLLVILITITVIFNYIMNPADYFLRAPKFLGIPADLNLALMSPTTAILFLLENIGLFIVYRHLNKYIIVYLAYLCGLIGVIISSTTIIGYALHIESWYSWFGFIGVALHTAIGFFILSSNLLLIIHSRRIKLSDIKQFTLALATFFGLLIVVLIQWQSLLSDLQKQTHDASQEINTRTLNQIAQYFQLEDEALQRFFSRVHNSKKYELWNVDTKNYLNDYSDLTVLGLTRSNNISNNYDYNTVLSKNASNEINEFTCLVTPKTFNPTIIQIQQQKFLCQYYKTPNSNKMGVAVIDLAKLFNNSTELSNAKQLFTTKFYVNNTQILDPTTRFPNKSLDQSISQHSTIISGNKFTLIFWPTNEYYKKINSNHSTLVLFFGIVFCLMASILTILLQLIQRNNRSLKKTILMRTRSLLKKKEEYKNLYNNSPDLFLSLDANLQITRYNLTLIKKLNYSTKYNPTGISIFQICAQEFHQEIYNIYEELRQEKSTTREAQLKLLTQSASPVYVQAIFRLSNIELSNSVEITMHDISREKHLEDQLINQQASQVMFKEHEELYLTVLGNVNDGWWDWNIHSGEIHYSHSVRTLLGYEQDFLQNDNLAFWNEVIFPEDATKVMQASDDALSKKGSYQVIARFKHSDDSTYWLIVRGCTIIDQDGIVRRIVGTFTNISEQYRLMDNLTHLTGIQEAILNAANQSIISTDCDGIIKTFNLGAEKMLGYTAKEVVNLHTPKLIHDIPEVVAMAHKLSQEFKTTIEPGFDVFVYRSRLGIDDLNQWTYISKSGKRIQVELSVTTLTDNDGNIYGYLGVARDISDLILINQELKQKEQLLEKTGQVALIGGWEMNYITGDSLWTKSMHELLDTPQDCLSSYKVDLINFLDDDSVRDMINNSFVNSAITNTSFDIEVQVKTCAMKYKWLRIKGFPVFENGICTRFYGVCHDITDRVNLIKQLEYERSRLAYIIDGTGLGTWEWNVQTGTTMFNQTWADIIGYTLEELQPISISTWIKFVHPDDMEQSSRLLEQHFRGETEFYHCEARMKHKHGHWVWVLDRGKVTTWGTDGKPELMYGTHQDISQFKLLQFELQNTATKFKNLFDLSTVGIALNEFSTGKFLEANNSLLNSIGYTFEELTALQYWEITPTEYSEQEKYQIECMLSSRSYGPYRKEYIKKDGSRYPVLLNGILTTDENGTDVIWSVVMDISSQVKYESEILKAKKQAESASIAKGNFVANMSHEIRTPMNAVIGLSQLLTTTQLSATQHNYVNKIISSSHLLLAIINDILDYSKIEAGKLTLEMVTFKLDDVLNQLITIFTATNRHAENLEFFIHIDNDVPDYLISDKLRITQVLTNLISNAVKFTPKGKVELIIKSLALNQQNKIVSLYIAVRDSGIGISPINQEHIFQPFTQSDSSITRKYGGTGLGLVISKQILKAMNSNLELQSEVGIGSQFNFTIDLEYIDPEEHSLEKLSSIRGKRVLLVDDEPITLTIIENILTGLGVKVLSLQSAEQALLAIQDQQQNHFDFLIIDWKLTGMNGLTAINKLKEMSQRGVITTKLPTIFLISAYSKAEISPDLHEEIPLLSKPVTKSVLINALLTDYSLERKETFLSPTITDFSRRLNLTTKNILIVEDNLINQEIVSLMLEQTGANIKVVNNGLEAVELCSQQNDPSIDLILMDLHMPIMSGYDAAIIIHKQLPTIPIIALTATVMNEDIQRVIESGMCDHIAKPIEMDKFYTVLAKWLNLSDLTFEPPVRNKLNQQNSNSDHLIKNELNSDKIINIQLLKEIVGDQLNIFTLLIKFKEQLTVGIKKIELAVDSNSFDELGEILHTLKGTSGNLRLNILFEYLCFIENCFKNEHNSIGTDQIQKLDAMLTQYTLELAEIESSIIKINDKPNLNNETITLTEQSTNLIKLLEEILLILSKNEPVASNLLENLSIMSDKNICQQELISFINLVQDFEFDAAISLGIKILDKLPTK